MFLFDLIITIDTQSLRMLLLSLTLSADLVVTIVIKICNQSKYSTVIVGSRRMYTIKLSPLLEYETV